eukprot:GILK01006144.1.p1 GENE.GILK01006144.1~~GILK01006144.1.p1  ORF type:complete len:321 (-),score=42.81 GILK01006144.1:134-1069(-)
MDHASKDVSVSKTQKSKKKSKAKQVSKQEPADPVLLDAEIDTLVAGLSLSDCMVLLDKKKEGSANFYVSFVSEPISDSLNPILGFYKMPTFAYYGNDYPQGEQKVIVRGHSSVFPFQLPQLISQQLVDSHNIPYPYDFFWVVSDIVSLLPRKTGLTPNLVHHGWRFPDVQPEPGERKNVRMLMGVFVSENSLSSGHVISKQLRVNELIYQNVHVHGKTSQPGLMCCSPNASKIALSGQTPMLAVWTVSLHDTVPKAVVSLQWLILEPIPELDESIQKAECLSALLSSLSNLEHAFVLAHVPELLQVFGVLA